MRITDLSISNVLSFRHVDIIDNATTVSFNPSLNIIIGENGAGKSTALEVVNFFFKKVLFREIKYEQSHFSHSEARYRKSTLSLANNPETFRDYYRLEPNWNSPDNGQNIRIRLTLDEVDASNIALLVAQHGQLRTMANQYSNIDIPELDDIVIDPDEIFTISASLNYEANNFNVSHDMPDELFFYLEHYEYINELIKLYNRRHQDAPIPGLTDSFTLLSAFRNYHSFNSAVSLANQEPDDQLRQLRRNAYSKGLNGSDGGEPGIFSVVKLRVAREHYRLIATNKTEAECEEEVNRLPFLEKINTKLALLHLKCQVKLKERRTWEYSFELFDTKHDRVMGDINVLSAGQKSIIHLIFEAYGRDELKGGVIVIDEPEIHLHYQFQDEYLRILQAINEDRTIQYILITHSDSLISSDSIRYVKRFSLDENRHTTVNSFSYTEDHAECVKFLDNMQSARVLFSKKVVLVEGQDDRYFFRDILNKLHPDLRQDVYVFDMGGKDGYTKWKGFFENLGLDTYAILDLDAARENFYSERGGYSLDPNKTPDGIDRFYAEHPDLEQKIADSYSEGLFILRKGSVEQYTGQTVKDLSLIIKFCEENMASFIESSDEESMEILNIISAITERI